MQCGRSKSTQLVKELARKSQNALRNQMRSGLFSIATDGSNDAESKQYPLVVRCIDPETGTVTSELLSVPECHGSATG